MKSSEAFTERGDIVKHQYRSTGESLTERVVLGHYEPSGVPSYQLKSAPAYYPPSRRAVLTYKLGKDIYIDIFKGSRQFNPRR